MAKYLLNTTSAIYLFKGGYLELSPGVLTPVTDIDFNSGIFEGAILAGGLKAFDTPEGAAKEAVADKGTAAPVVNMANVKEDGASPDELKAFIEAQAAKRNGKTEVLAPAPIEVLEDTPEVNAVASVKVEPVTDTTAEAKLEDIETAPKTRGRKASA